MKALLTRARPDAEASARKLAARGVEAVLAPVLEIVCQRLAGAPQVDFALATSRHAFPCLDAMDPARRAALAARPLYVVGDATAAAARAAGFTDVRIARGDAVSMLDLLVLTGARGRALYLAGADRSPTLEAGLERMGVETRVEVAYVARARDWSGAERRAAGAAADDGASVLHYSGRSAELFLRQLDAAGLGGRLDAFRHVAMSRQAAAPIQNQGSRVIWPDRPAEDALFALLSF